MGSLLRCNSYCFRRSLGKLDNKESSKSPAHSLDRLALRGCDRERPRRPSRLDFLNSNDIFVAVSKTKKIVSRSNSQEKRRSSQDCLCVLNNAPRKYEEIGNPTLTWAFKDKCEAFHGRLDPDNSDRLEKPSPIHSDDGNSPTALNTCRFLTDKPPLVKVKSRYGSKIALVKLRDAFSFSCGPPFVTNRSGAVIERGTRPWT